MILLDTDHLSLLQVRDAPAAFALQARLEAFTPDEVVTTVITMEEQMRGWLALIHRGHRRPAAGSLLRATAWPGSVLCRVGSATV